MFERFTDRAREVLAVAQQEARGLQHNFLGTEHILLGLLAGDGVAARVLRAEGLDRDEVRAAIRTWIGPGHHGHVPDAEALKTIGIDLEQVTAAVEESFGKGALHRPIGPKGRKKLPWSGPPFVPRAKKVVELSLREALSFGHNYIGTEHLLLAILREGEGMAAMLLAERTDPTELRTKVLDELRRLRPGA